MNIVPLSFTNPMVERQTYVDAMANSIIDRTDGNLSVENSVAILIAYGYDTPSIARYIDDAHQQAKETLKKWHCVKTIS